MGDSRKSRVFYLLKFLFQHTDEDHRITTNELVEHLAEQVFHANRKTKTVKDDINMQTVSGYHIVLERGGNNNTSIISLISGRSKSLIPK